ncbi:MAG: 4-hydroxy-4-methyl-2-oxoglutarate aldolase [Acidimicrobiaceae bacterium]
MEDLLALGAATLGEAGGSAMAPRIRAVWPGAVLAAPAYAVVCPAGDNLAIHAAVAEAPSGSVLCVEIAGQPEFGYWGEVLTTAAESRGIVGLVIDACVRDVAALEAHGFPVFSVGIALPGAAKVGPGSIGGVAVVGGAHVTTGDVLVGDRDGVTVIPAIRHDEVVAAGRARAESEAAMFEQLRAGSTTVELLSLDTSSIERA